MKFNIILADPAWTYDDAALAGQRGAGCKYAQLTDDELYDLPVHKLAADHCVLLLWATMPKLREALDVGAAWGFTYKTCAFTWVKSNRAWHALTTWFAEDVDTEMTSPVLTALVRMAAKLTPNRWFMGMGRWTRSNAEVCLLFVKGKPSRYSADVNQIIDAPRMRHSAKPPETRQRIERLCGKLPRIELFARERCDGWVSLGYDIDGQDLRTSIPKLAKKR